ncbi:Uncharacterized protein APZ42_010588 [Daphnia magna]|uniref:Uncharacterized protein n=1 Tax=Daphnia magna TaxID=35525 RepID=A0A164DBB5_9CRUS|nr:Uncharacterized protein APZ42_010588 [Daphnia magna]
MINIISGFCPPQEPCVQQWKNIAKSGVARIFTIIKKNNNNKFF